MSNLDVQNKPKSIVLPALCLKDFGTSETNYATLVLMCIKKLETRTWATNHRGDLLITCSKSSKSIYAGKALCVVSLDGIRTMVEADEKDACIALYPNAKAWELSNVRPLSRMFSVKSQLSIFKVELPSDVTY